ncbi:MAG: hypothetical protein Q8867_06070 [Bacteroidota bacterium]|nr:hypothetical protein [Bacteroidota bacterium]
MKSKKIFQFGFLLFAASLLVITGCKKENTTTTNGDSSSVQELSQDENNMQKCNDEIDNDINKVMNGNGQEKSTMGIPCNATVDSSTVVNDTITLYITYNGHNCNNKLFRTGQVEIKKKTGTHWYQAGATVTVVYKNLKITRVATGKSITMNGTKIHENVSGGLLFMVGTYINSLVNKEWGALSCTFDDGTAKVWNVARQITYTGSLGAFVMTIDGFGTSGNYQNLVMWGTTRNGKVFYDQIQVSLILKEACDFDPCSGVKVITMPENNSGATLTFGYDSNNQLITNGDCPSKYKVDWYHGSASGTIYLWLR